MGQALERFKEQRGALVARQADEWGKIREAWKQVGREKVPERGNGVVQERKAEARPHGSRFGWLDRQAEVRGVPAKGTAEPQQQVEQTHEEKTPSKFDWLNRRKGSIIKVRERDDPVGCRQDRDQFDRER